MNDTAGAQEISVKMYRSPERLTIAAPMPGMEPENILVEVTDGGSLSLHGLLRGEQKGENEVLLDEWNPGPYHRRLDLPVAVDAELANAS